MLKLSKKTDYALMAVQYMSSGGADRVVNTKEIAEEYNIPVELLAKVLQKLGKKGLIVSQNGPKGGYVLAKSSTDISVLSVNDLARTYPPLGPFWLTIKPFFPNFWRTLASSSTGMLYSSAISLVLTTRSAPPEAMY